MRRICGIAVAAALLAGGAEAKRLPGTIGYTIYAEGKYVGASEITVTYEGELLIMESRTTVDSGPFKLRLSCRTEADAKTYAVRRFSWEGEKSGNPYSGEIFVEGTSIRGTREYGDAPVADNATAPREPVIVFEDYVFEHQVLLARAHAASGETGGDYSFFLPSSFYVTGAGLRFTGEATVESEEADAICRKLVIAMGGSEPYPSYYDEERGLPVYIAFGSTFTEAFLDEFYGDEPISTWVPAKTE